MRKTFSFTHSDPDRFKTKLMFLSSCFSHTAFLNSNTHCKTSISPPDYYNYGTIAGIGCLKELYFKEDPFETLDSFIKNTDDYIFGFLGYDLKNNIEDLKSENPDNTDMPGMHFFVPQYVFIFENNRVKVLYQESNDNYYSIRKLLFDIESVSVPKRTNDFIEAIPRFSFENYISAVKQIQQHIMKGDIYEMNFCMEFFSNQKLECPLNTFLNLTSVSPTPFSCYYNLNDKYLLCASPERFIKRTGQRIISQPMKGTINRSRDIIADEELSNTLKNDAKEIAENIMIVDLVRNDLSKIAVEGTVVVDELCKVYPFPNIHQMISTISAKIQDGTSNGQIFKALFPMGSMTGAPKKRAMELIEKYECAKRGLYSGAVGYITPDQNFDFNVVIRSIIYNDSAKYVSYSTGSAITAESIPEKEYAECLLKAETMKKTLSATKENLCHETPVC